MPPLSFPRVDFNPNTLTDQPELSFGKYGLGPQQILQPSLKEFSKSFDSDSDSRAQPIKSKLPEINFKQEANKLFNEVQIRTYLDAIRLYKDPNIAFQDLVNTFVGKTFLTPGNTNPEMKDYVNKFMNALTIAARELINHPNDRQKHYGLNGFYGLLWKLATYIRPSKGGRKTARNRGRSRGGKKTRARKLKQRSRKRAVRRR
jgi:hypothetical protein